MSLIDDLKASGAKPAAMEPEVSNKPAGIAGSGLVSAAAGFNQGVENLTLGAVQLGSKIADNLFGTDLTSKVGAVKSELERQENVFKDTNPTAFAVGKGVGSVAATVPTMMIPGAGPANIIRLGTQGLAQGALTGALMYTDDGTVSSHIVNGMIGAAVGGAVGGTLGAAADTMKAVTNGMSTYMRGFNAGKDGARHFIDDVTIGVQSKLNPSNMEVTAKNVINTIDDKFKEVNALKNANYAARDFAANKSGIMVDTPVTNDTIKEIGKSFGTRTSPEEVSILKTLNSFGGEKPVTVTQAYELLKRVGNLRQSSLATDPNKARLLGQIQDSVDLDLNNAITKSGNTDVQQLHDIANNFYKETFVPIKEIAKSKAIDKLTEDAFVAKLANQAKTSYGVNAGLDKIGGDIRNQIAGSHMNAIKESLTDPVTGLIDFSGYVGALNRDLLKNPGLAKTAEDIGKLNGLVDVVKKATMDRGTGLGQVVGTAASIASMNPLAYVGSMLAAGMPKAKALYTLGKMIESADVQNLLLVTKNLDQAADPIKKAVAVRAAGAMTSIFKSSTMQSIEKLGIQASVLGLTSPKNDGLNKIASPRPAVEPPAPVGGIRG